MVWRIFVADPAGGRSRFVLYGAITGDRAKAEEAVQSLRVTYSQIYMFPTDTEVRGCYGDALVEARALFSRPEYSGIDNADRLGESTT